MTLPQCDLNSGIAKVIPLFKIMFSVKNMKDNKQKNLFFWGIQMLHTIVSNVRQLLPILYAIAAWKFGD